MDGHYNNDAVTHPKTLFFRQQLILYKGRKSQSANHIQGQTEQEATLPDIYNNSKMSYSILSDKTNVTHGTIALDIYGPGPGFLATLAIADYIRFSLITVSACAASLLNGFMLWVFSKATTELTAFEKIQMNQAAFDVFDAIFGHGSTIAARVVAT